MSTYLAPIEHPKGWVMRLAYLFTRRSFGKVLTPLKVHLARLPPAFGLFYNKIGSLDKKLTLPTEDVFLIREWVAHLNRCEFCIDIGRSLVREVMHDPAKFDALAGYPETGVFSPRERAALDYAAELTRHRRVEPETFNRLAEHYSEREICEIVWIVASEHLYNLTNLGLNIHSDGLCALANR